MISALTRVSFERNFIRFLSEIHGMRQNSQNSKQKTEMNRFNRVVNPLTLTLTSKTNFDPLDLNVIYLLRISFNSKIVK